MAITPEARAHLLHELRSVLDSEAISTMAAYLGDTDGLIGRFDQVDATLAAHGRRLDRMDDRFDGIDGRLDVMDTRLGSLEHEVQMLRHELIATFRGDLIAALQTQNRTLLLGVLSVGVTFAAAAIGLGQLL